MRSAEVDRSQLMFEGSRTCFSLVTLVDVYVVCQEVPG